METTFDFTKKYNEYVLNMDFNTILNIKRHNNSVAVLYFTDEASNIIYIPYGISVFEYDEYQNKVLLKPSENTYPLCWTDNYTVEYNNKVLLTIKNERKWNIKS